MRSSLGIALGILFLLSFVMHWTQSAHAAAEEAREHGEAALSTIAYLGDPQLWFESFQNWQSEFLSTAVLIVLSIFLRQRESPNRNRSRHRMPRLACDEPRRSGSVRNLPLCPPFQGQRGGELTEAVMKPNDTDATHILTNDHRAVEKLFAAFDKAGGKGEKGKLADQICTELKIHAQIEEEVFYPALKGKIDDDLLKEAYVEHDGAKVLINEIVAAGPDDEFFEAKVTVLKEEIEHHVKEEEKQHDNMFQQARAADIDLDALGERMLARKQELKAKAEAEGLPPAELATM